MASTVAGANHAVAQSSAAGLAPNETGPNETGPGETGQCWATPCEAGLWQTAAAAGLQYGSASDIEIGSAPAAYAAAFVRHCELLAPNMGWHRAAPWPGSDQPAWEDPNIGFARTHRMRLTGGHLLWHKALPGYFLAAASGGPAQALAADHIRMMVSHYAGQVFSWNVVNEAIDTTASDSNNLRRSPLLAKLGPAYITEAFKTARDAAPDTLLAYNDTQFEMDTRHHEARRSALLRLLDRLGRDGAPIGAVGLQTHLRLDGERFEAGRYRRFLQDIASRRLRILITELDVFDIGVVGTAAQRDGAVAALYRDVLAVILDEPAVASVVTWGLSDRYTWLTPKTDARYVRADGLPARPLPLDDAFQPKQAFDAVADAFHRARSRSPA